MYEKVVYCRIYLHGVNTFRNDLEADWTVIDGNKDFLNAGNDGNITNELALECQFF